MQTFEYLMMFVVYLLLLAGGTILLGVGAILTGIAVSIALITYFPCIILDKIWNKWC
jgi:hypothetical protein